MYAVEYGAVVSPSVTEHEAGTFGGALAHDPDLADREGDRRYDIILSLGEKPASGE